MSNKKKNNLIETKQPAKRAVLVIAEIEKTDSAEDLNELASLCETAGVQAVGRLVQKRSQPDPRTLIGKGKLEELKQLAEELNADVVVFDNELSGSKLSNLEEELGRKVLTRSMLILDIFALRAQSSEGKLQVELAQLKYTLPRSGNMLKSGNRFGGGVGMRGPGESQIELNKRVIEEKILKLEKELKEVKNRRSLNRVGRKGSSKKTVGIVGYTNSGKSTLMNVLANAGVYAKDELFATLDTTTRSVWLGDGKEILLIDTVGFINKLPHEFIHAFSSTLEETVHADILLHVVDISDKNFALHQEVVNNLLKELGVNCPIVMVYNKTDKMEDISVVKELISKDAVFVSALKKEGIERLKEKIKQTIK